MKTLDTWKFALAAAVTFGLLSAACAIAVVISPDATIAVINSFMHGVDLTRLVPPGGRVVTFGQVIAGVISAAVISFASGATLAGCYNLLVARNRGEPLPDDRQRST